MNKKVVCCLLNSEILAHSWGEERVDSTTVNGKINSG